jgi:hypothetical protein
MRTELQQATSDSLSKVLGKISAFSRMASGQKDILKQGMDV